MKLCRYILFMDTLTEYYDISAFNLFSLLCCLVMHGILSCSLLTTKFYMPEYTFHVLKFTDNCHAQLCVDILSVQLLSC